MGRTRIIAAVVLIGLVVAAAVLLTARRDAPGRPGADGILEVVMEDYAFSPAELTVTAGEPVTFRFVNRDEVSHHVSFGRDVVEEGGRDVGFAEDLLAGLSPRVSPATAWVELDPPYVGDAILVQGGQTVDVSVTVPVDRVGEWQAGCFTGRGCHFRAGLAATLVVEAP
jgi:plastocyanin